MPISHISAKSRKITGFAILVEEDGRKMLVMSDTVVEGEFTIINVTETLQSDDGITDVFSKGIGYEVSMRGQSMTFVRQTNQESLPAITEIVSRGLLEDKHVYNPMIDGGTDPDDGEEYFDNQDPFTEEDYADQEEDDDGSVEEPIYTFDENTGILGIRVIEPKEGDDIPDDYSESKYDETY